MTSDDPAYPPSYPPRRDRWVAVLMVVIAFAAGIGATAFVIAKYREWAPQTARPMQQPSAATPAIANSPMFMPPAEVGSGAANVDSDTLNAREVALAAELANLEARASIIDRDSHLAASNAGRAEGMLIAFAVRRAIDRGSTLGYLEEQVRARFSGAQPAAVAAILQASKQPVTLEDLRAQVESIGPALTSGALKDGWWASLRREFTGLIVLRREGTPSPRPAARFDRIRRLLQVGQVEPALTEVARLPGAAQASGWSAAAKRYVETQKALDIIESAAIVGMGGAMPAVAAVAPSQTAVAPAPTAVAPAQTAAAPIPPAANTPATAP